MKRFTGLACVLCLVTMLLSGICLAPAAKAKASGSVGGKITAIPCTGGYEIETTEFDFEATYAPNDALVAGTGDLLGKVAKATASTADIGTAPVVGFVSKPMFSVDSYQQKRISFWTNFIPASHA